MGRGVFASVLERVQQLRIKACQAGQILGIHLVGLSFVGVDEPCLAGVGYEDLVATLLEHPARPRRVGTRFYGDAQRGLRSEASSEGLGVGAQPALFDDLAVVRVDEAQGGYLSPRSNPAVIRGCCLLPSMVGRSSFRSGIRARKMFADPKGTAYLGGRPSHLILELPFYEVG